MSEGLGAGSTLLWNLGDGDTAPDVGNMAQPPTSPCPKQQPLVPCVSGSLLPGSPLQSIVPCGAGPELSAGGLLWLRALQGASIPASCLLFPGMSIGMKSPRRLPQQLLCTCWDCARYRYLSVCVTWFFLGALGGQFRLEGSRGDTWTLNAQG